MSNCSEGDFAEAKKPILVYPDASGPGHIGVVAFSEGSPKSFRAQLPARFLEENDICEFEIVGMIYGLLVASVIMPGPHFNARRYQRRCWRNGARQL